MDNTTAIPSTVARFQSTIKDGDYLQFLASANFAVAGSVGLLLNVAFLYCLGYADPGQYRLLKFQAFNDLAYSAQNMALGFGRMVVVLLGVRKMKVERWFCLIFPGRTIMVENCGSNLATLALAICRLIGMIKPVWFKDAWEYYERRYITCWTALTMSIIAAYYINIITDPNALIGATCPGRHTYGELLHLVKNYIKFGANALSLIISIVAVVKAKVIVGNKSSDHESRLNRTLVVLIGSNVVMILIPALISGFGSVEPIQNQMLSGLQIWNASLNFPLCVVYIRELRKLVARALNKPK